MPEHTAVGSTEKQHMQQAMPELTAAYSATQCKSAMMKQLQVG
jgi:hypothetical protein